MSVLNQLSMQFIPEDKPPDIMNGSVHDVQYVDVNQMFESCKRKVNGEFGDSSGINTDPLGMFNNIEKIVNVQDNKFGDEHCTNYMKDTLQGVNAIIEGTYNKNESSDAKDLNFDIDIKEHSIVSSDSAFLQCKGVFEISSDRSNEEEKTFTYEEMQNPSLSGQKKTEFPSGEKLQQRELKMYVCDCQVIKSLETKNPQKVITLLTDVNDYINTGNIKTEYFKCKGCNKMYSVVDNLSRHINEQFTKLCNLKSCENVAHKGFTKLEDLKSRKNVARKGFTKLHNLKSNKNVATKEIKRYVCQVCNEVFGKRMMLTQHNSICHKARKYVCGICDRKFFELGALNNHMDFVHKGIKKFKCGECPRAYRSLFSLRDHINAAHSRLINYMCEKCGEMFPQQGGLKKHKYSKHGEVNYKCEECRKTFSTLYVLKCHIKGVHEGIRKNTKCDECDKTFSWISHKKRHIETVHRKIKKYKCPSCDKTFTQKSNMNIHISGVHYGIKKYECGLCLRTFLHCRDLKLHVNSAHSQIKDYVCLECQKKYSSKTSLKHHIESLHKL